MVLVGALNWRSSSDPLLVRCPRADMGLAADLGYAHRAANPFQRVVQASPPPASGAWLFSKTLRHLDDVVGRVTRGRHSAPAPARRARRCST